MKLTLFLSTQGFPSQPNAKTSGPKQISAYFDSWHPLKMNNIYDFKNWSAIFLIAILSTACSSDQDCFVTDRHELMKSVNVGEKEYSVYLRTTGFQEKEFFYVLYSGLPSFDICGQASLEALKVEHLNLDGSYPAKIVLDGSTMTVEYIESNTKNIQLNGIPIELL